VNLLPDGDLGSDSIQLDPCTGGLGNGSIRWFFCYLKILPWRAPLEDLVYIPPGRLISTEEGLILSIGEPLR
jgi:hypothetical protein